MSRISIIIPCFNEEKNLPNLFIELKSYFKEHTDMDFIFVNDGSDDSTYKLLQDFSAKNVNLCKVIAYSKNEGKGFAIRKGIFEAKGDWVGFMDADLSVSLPQIDDALLFMNESNDIVIGSRNLPQSKLEVPQNYFRKILGRNFTIFANLVTGLKVSDFTCGFKFFSSTAKDIIFKKAFINRWTYDVELLYLANKHNLKIKEIPVLWKNGTDSKVNIFKDIFTSFFDTLRMLFIHKFLK